jgi:hypothetical protein
MTSLFFKQKQNNKNKNTWNSNFLFKMKTGLDRRIDRGIDFDKSGLLIMRREKAGRRDKKNNNTQQQQNLLYDR